jgi:hypothetical protein
VGGTRLGSAATPICWRRGLLPGAGGGPPWSDSRAWNLRRGLWKQKQNIRASGSGPRSEGSFLVWTPVSLCRERLWFGPNQKDESCFGLESVEGARSKTRDGLEFPRLTDWTPRLAGGFQWRSRNTKIPLREGILSSLHSIIPNQFKKQACEQTNGITP